MATAHLKKAISLALFLLSITAFSQELAIVSAGSDTTYYAISDIQKMETDNVSQDLLVFIKDSAEPDQYQLSSDLGVYFFYQYPVSTLPDRPKISPPPLRIRYTRHSVIVTLKLPGSDKITARLVNARGEHHKLLADEIVPAGSWDLQIPRDQLGHGIYYVRIQSASQSFSIPVAGTREGK